MSVALALVIPFPLAATLRYVDANSPNPTPPYTNWVTAAAVIQDAVDTADAGDEIIVTDGIYAAGGRAVSGTMTNRVALDKALTLRSVNGPQFTIIQGSQAPGGGLGDGAVRCVYVGTNAVLSGFTLSNGYTLGSADYITESGGGGAWCEMSGVVTNCTLGGNSARQGGGVYRGTLNNCTLLNNSASDGGGAYGATLNHCTLSNNSSFFSGGGASGGTLNYCTLSSNSVWFYGGGAYECSLNYCTLTGNSATLYGGGASAGTLSHCTLSANSADYGGGAYGGTLNYCTLSNNSSANGGGGASGGTLNYCTLTGNSAYYGGGTAGGTLDNCILSGNSAEYSGGGASDGTLNNCTLSNNSSAFSGGGAAAGILNNCILTGNSALFGGGAEGSYWGMLNNCTLTGNFATGWAGGASGALLTNCIVYYNTAPADPNYSLCSLAYCCTTPLPAGLGNLDAEPLLASATHLSAQSPCIGRGSAAYAHGVDIDGEAWLDPPCIGADQFVAGSTLGPLTVAIAAAYTNVSTGFAVTFQALIEGRLSASVWDFGDGIVVSNRLYISHAWAVPGDYLVRLTGYSDSHPNGGSATVLVKVGVAEVYYVDAANATPTPPYTNWAGAARNIQEAIDAGTQIGRLVWVADGVYESGGQAVYGLMANRVVVTEGVEVRSLNGPAVTVIAGAPAPSGGDGDGAMRCVYVGTNAVLSGFTLTNGHTRGDGDYSKERSGGGAWCEISGVVTNCIFNLNSAAESGGGAYGGTLKNCTLSGNSASAGGGAFGGTLNNCTLSANSAITHGGGAYACTLNNCALSGNSATQEGGGACSCTINNCTLSANSALTHGGGAYSCTINNCALSRNSATQEGGGANGGTLNNCTLSGNSASWGGGVFDCTLENCIVYYNSAATGPNYYESTLRYCCTIPLPEIGAVNITNTPLFVDFAAGNLRLQTNSPCINSGNHAYVVGASDLDGSSRIISGAVDIGAYEYQGPGSTISFAWLQQYGLPTDGSADDVDFDSDGHNNWQEWVAGTDPTNSLSVLRLEVPSLNPSGVLLRWSSVTNRTYVLERCTGPLTPASFLPVSSSIPGQPGTTSCTDTNTGSLSPLFYRVRLGN